MNQTQWQEEAMAAAFALALEAAAEEEIPVGAVVVDREGRTIGRGRNRRESGDPLGHAEIYAIHEAARAIGDWRLEGTTMFVTLEPCAMCAGAIVLGRLDRVVFGAFDDKAGMAGSIVDLLRHPRLNHRPQVQAGVLAEETGSLLSGFFRARR
jgi:tRNA(adenine34) deaminase